MHVQVLQSRAGRRAVGTWSMAVLLCGSYMAAALGSPTRSGRELQTTELGSIFGDGTDPCQKTFACKDPFTTGSTDIKCEYCDSMLQRTVCCNLGNSSNCTYGGPTTVCQGAAHKIGPINNMPGTCNSCTSLVYVTMGNCAGTQNGTGTNCP